MSAITAKPGEAAKPKKESEDRMEKTQRDNNRKKEPTDEHLDSLCGLFGLTLMLALLWLMRACF
jgi:hypothetical protein